MWQGGYMSVVVEQATIANAELIDAFNRLIPQLSTSNKPPTHIVGSLTLATFRIPTGVRAWIEDVVVDAAVRGHGVGEALNQAAILEARHRGAITVELTSRPSREAANRLYQRIGFVARETNVYRHDL
jgi:ribosomal protein S18 acetylase RimI-like enzyme